MLSCIFKRRRNHLNRAIPLLLASIAMAMCSLTAYSQSVGVKTNLVSDATLSPNLGVEIGLAPKWTFDLSGQFNLWKLSHDRQWRHWALQPEGRYWFCDRFMGHFVGAHLLGGEYNIGGIDFDFSMLGTDFSKLKDTRYQGWFVGAGVAYGYDWALNQNWNLEAEIGLGWTYTRFDRYRCTGCGKKIESNKPHNYFGPTKIALNIVYVF